MNSESQQLTARVRQNPEAAMVGLIELHYAAIYAFLRRLSGNDADAADLTQRAFSRVQQALSSFAARSSVSSWIHGIAYHIYLDWRRANGRMEARSDHWWAGQVSTEIAPDQQLNESDLRQRLYSSVDALEPDLRDSIHLHYYQDLTLQETADAMGVATSTVKYRLRQALAQLQKQFAVELQDPFLHPRH